jgi:hypothetical protein
MRSAASSRSGTWAPAGSRTRSSSPARVRVQRMTHGTRSLREARSAWRQASAHLRRMCERASAAASGSRVQFSSPTTNATATIRESAR